MIHHIVQFALRQRFLVVMLALLVIVAGALSFQRMPVDAYPDLAPPMVEVITQWPGHAAEEIERRPPPSLGEAKKESLNREAAGAAQDCCAGRCQP